MNDFGVIDFRDEFYLKIFRRWHLVKVLAGNAKFLSGVPLQKAAFVDFLLCNPPVMQRLLVHFGRAEPMLNLEDLLYQDNMEYGSVQDIKDFSRTCALLISKRYMAFRKSEGEILLIPDSNELFLENGLAKKWKSEIESLQPILNKSINVLCNSALGGN
jgi:hypothetical protein